MTERSPFDSFEQRIAAGLERYVVPASDPKPATEIARTAMRPRGLVVRARNASRPRRFLLLGLAAALLLPAAYIGAMATRPPTPNPVIQVQPPRTDDPLPTTEPSTPEPSAAAPLKDYVSIFVRRDEGPEPGLSIFAARPDGSEVVGAQGARLDRARARHVVGVGHRFGVGLACRDQGGAWRSLADDPHRPGRRVRDAVGGQRGEPRGDRTALGTDRARRSLYREGTA